MSIYCPKCGELMDDDTIFCGNCGAKMEEQPPVIDEEPATLALETPSADQNNQPTVALNEEAPEIQFYAQAEHNDIPPAQFVPQQSNPQPGDGQFGYAEPQAYAPSQYDHTVSPQESYVQQGENYPAVNADDAAAPEKKSKKGLIITIVAIVALIGVAAAVVLIFDPFGWLGKKSAGSAEATTATQATQNNSVSDVSFDTPSKAAEAFLNSFFVERDTTKAINTSYEFKVADIDAKEMESLTQLGDLLAELTALGLDAECSVSDEETLSSSEADTVKIKLGEDGIPTDGITDYAKVSGEMKMNIFGEESVDPINIYCVKYDGSWYVLLSQLS